MRESAIEKRFVGQVQIRRGEVRKVKWIGRAHAPDRLAMMPHTHFYAELKATGKDARDGQAREHERMRRAGMKVYVLNSIEAIDNFFYHFDRGARPQ
jgi:hypothetical protein